jgi:hypothetical protein
MGKTPQSRPRFHKKRPHSGMLQGLSHKYFNRLA